MCEKKIVEAQGLICPEPIMMLHSAVRDVDFGDVVKLVATDPSTVRDIQQFCEFLGHSQLKMEQEGNVYTFWIRKKATKT